MTGRLAGPVLLLEASTAVGVVALLIDGGGTPVAVTLGAGREDVLWAAAVRALDEAGCPAASLAAVVCGAGPGSFTSLRIAAALAKGVAHGAGCPLLAVPSLLLAATALDAPGSYLVHADALRGERYVLPVRCAADGLVDIDGPAARLPIARLDEAATGRRRVALVGSPEPALEDMVVSPAGVRLDRLAPQWLASPVPLDRWEPSYGRLAEAQVQWEARHGVPLPDVDAHAPGA
jgi:tRNA threonylcarbamoyladenosine biosynthesis protein TsaB